MPRRPLDQMPQARLVLELKLAIDRKDVRSVTNLTAANPRSSWARHVQRNIGKRRAAWMAASDAGQAIR